MNGTDIFAWCLPTTLSPTLQSFRSNHWTGGNAKKMTCGHQSESVFSSNKKGFSNVNVATDHRSLSVTVLTTRSPLHPFRITVALALALALALGIMPRSIVLVCLILCFWIHPTAGSCIDDDASAVALVKQVFNMDITSCSQVLDYCAQSSQVADVCPVTCDECPLASSPSPVLVPSPLPSSCVDDDASAVALVKQVFNMDITNCSQVLAYCAQSSQVADVCPVTCGECPLASSPSPVSIPHRPLSSVNISTLYNKYHCHGVAKQCETFLSHEFGEQSYSELFAKINQFGGLCNYANAKLLGTNGCVRNTLGFENKDNTCCCCSSHFRDTVNDVFKIELIEDHLSDCQYPLDLYCPDIDCHECLAATFTNSSKEIDWCLQKSSTGTHVLPTGLSHACILNNSVSVQSLSIQQISKLMLSAHLSGSSKYATLYRNNSRNESFPMFVVGLSSEVHLTNINLDGQEYPGTTTGAVFISGLSSKLVMNGCRVHSFIVKEASLLETKMDVSAGIFADRFADLTITASIIANNSDLSVSGSGGGLHLTGQATAVLRDTDIHNNHAGFAGGGT